MLAGSRPNASVSRSCRSLSETWDCLSRDKRRHFQIDPSFLPADGIAARLAGSCGREHIRRFFASLRCCLRELRPGRRARTSVGMRPARCSYDWSVAQEPSCGPQAQNARRGASPRRRVVACLGTAQCSSPSSGEWSDARCPMSSPLAAASVVPASGAWSWRDCARPAASEAGQTRRRWCPGGLCCAVLVCTGSAARGSGRRRLSSGLRKP